VAGGTRGLPKRAVRRSLLSLTVPAPPMGRLPRRAPAASAGPRSTGSWTQRRRHGPPHRGTEHRNPTSAWAASATQGLRTQTQATTRRCAGDAAHLSISMSIFSCVTAATAAQSPNACHGPAPFQANRRTRLLEHGATHNVRVDDGTGVRHGNAGDDEPDLTEASASVASRQHNQSQRVTVRDCLFSPTPTA